MRFFRPHIWWTDRLRWYERAALALWLLGQAVCAACVVGAAWLLFETGLSRDSQSAAAALLLLGVVSLVGGRALLAAATRRRRWRRLH